ncbi:hypothetical protein NDN08_001586 [Rhodosorus marinus]|uniref:Sugar phosphate transporter domain-containing protein n=1 Tax=Rhodosorus marinus TaxID=101924 RepID=A0AAV8UR72_9RHOD|nr:hypothetical protein NDN08_001586 [Rhodosorus marinus]
MGFVGVVGINKRGISGVIQKRPLRIVTAQAETSPWSGSQGDDMNNPGAERFVNEAANQVDDGVFSEGPLLPPRLVRVEKEKRESEKSGFWRIIVLGGLFLSWYASNTAFNVFNKQVLKVYPYPLTCTMVQFLVGSIMMASLWVFRLRRIPVVDWDSIRTLGLLSALHASGFYLTNASLGSVSIAFTHTVKSTEPFFSVALSPSLLGEVPTWGVLATLVPIVFGVGLASATEASFTWFGFVTAMGSNLCLQGRNLISKRFMKKGESSIDNVNLFSLISIGAFLILLPISSIVEGPAAVSAISALNVPFRTLVEKLFYGGFFRCVDVLTSYMILKQVSPVTHSVGNCVKRAIVITSSVILFRTAISPVNIFGTSLALLGVLVYSLVVVGCKQNKFGPDSPLCRPVYEELDLVEGAGI